MSFLYSLLLLAGLVIVAVALLKLLLKPIKFVFKLLINTALGFVLLWLVNFFGDPLGISIGLTFINALVVGFMGVPGVILLVLLELFL